MLAPLRHEVIHRTAMWSLLHVWHTGGVNRLLLLIGAVALIAQAGASAATVRTQPSLIVEHYAPLTVVGTAFAGGARYVVSAKSSSATETRTVRATAAGRIVARFTLKVDRCVGGVAIAVRLPGRSAAVATTKLVARACLPPDRRP
jgi:hypothetical protein